MDEPNWATVLREMYRGRPKSYDNQYSKDHPLVEATGLTPREVTEAMGKLREWSLVDAVKRTTVNEDDSRRYLSLNEDGFDVAYERELNQRQTKTNKSLVILTFALVGVSAIQALGTVLPRGGLLTLGATLLLAVVLVGIYRVDFEV